MPRDTPPAHTPVFTTAAIYSAYLDAARFNLNALIKLAKGYRDSEFEAEAQRVLDCFDSEAADAFALIAEADGRGEHKEAA